MAVSQAKASLATPGPRAYNTTHRFSVSGISGIVAAHVGVLALLATLEVVPLPAPPATLMVDIIQPLAPPSAPEIAPPRPPPVQRKPAPKTRPTPRQQPQILTTQTEASNRVAEVPVVKETGSPEPTPAPTAATAQVAPASVTPARFDADYLQNPAPTYPALSRRMGEEGKVILRVFVEPSGRPSQVEVKTGSGSPRLDQAALDAVRRWKFVAARRGDEAIGAWVLVPIVFNLRS